MVVYMWPSTDPECVSYDPACHGTPATGSTLIRQSPEIRQPIRPDSRSFAQLAMGSPNPPFNLQ